MPTAALVAPLPQPAMDAGPAPSSDALAEATRRYAQTGDDSALVALGVLPVGKPVRYA